MTPQDAARLVAAGVASIDADALDLARVELVARCRCRCDCHPVECGEAMADDAALIRGDCASGCRTGRPLGGGTIPPCDAFLPTGAIGATR